MQTSCRRDADERTLEHTHIAPGLAKDYAVWIRRHLPMSTKGVVETRQSIGQRSGCGTAGSRHGAVRRRV